MDSGSEIDCGYFSVESITKSCVLTLKSLRHWWEEVIVNLQKC